MNLVKFDIKGKKVKGPTQPTLRLLGADHCRQIALFHGCDTTRAPLLEASPSHEKLVVPTVSTPEG